MGEGGGGVVWGGGGGGSERGWGRGVQSKVKGS